MDYGLFACRLQTSDMTAIPSSARIGASTTFGQFCVVEEDVILGRDCGIGHHVVLRSGTRIGDGVTIGDHASLGKRPMRSANTALAKRSVAEPLVVADGCIVGTGVVLYAGCSLGEGVMVADLATIRERVSVGAHTIVGRGVAIENDCTVGRYCKLETNCYITAYSCLEDRVFVAPGVLTGNDNFIGRTHERHKHFKGVTVRRGGRIGLGAVVLPGRIVERDALVAAGSVLTRNAPERQIWAGTPARFLRKVPEEQLLEKQGWPDVDE